MAAYTSLKVNKATNCGFTIGGMRALQVYAGPQARRLLADQGLQPHQVRMVSAAAGGPKGLVLTPLDQYLFGQWLVGDGPPVHLVGASIGAWRMAAACQQDAASALRRLTRDYIDQAYDHAPGRRPTAEHVSQVFGQMLSAHVGGVARDILAHPRLRLHVVTSRGRGLLGREGRWRTPLGYLGAYATNLVSRRALGAWLERVVFSDPRDRLPIRLDDFPGRTVPLLAQNLQPAILASCSIPFWLQAVQDMPGAPVGAYWDGGITDYHLHLRYDTLGDGLALYPHFQPRLIPGWLDKGLRHRHRATPALSRVVVLAPHPRWVAALPGGKLPDRSDFQAFGDDLPARRRVWQAAVTAGQQLADDFADWVAGRWQPDLHPL